MEKNIVVKSLRAALFALVLTLSFVVFSDNVHAEETTAGDQTATKNNDLVGSLTNTATDLVKTLTNSLTANNTDTKSNTNTAANTNTTTNTTQNNQQGDNNSTGGNNTNLPPTVTKDPTKLQDTDDSNALVKVRLGGNLLGGLLGEVKVDVLGSEQSKDGSYTSSGIAKVDIKDSKLLGNAHVGVGESTTTKSGTNTTQNSGLVLAEVSNPILGNIDAGVLQSKQVTDKDYKYNYNGVANVNLKIRLLAMHTLV